MSKKFLRFEKDDVYFKVWNNKNDFLGVIEFLKRWKKWVFKPDVSYYSEMWLDSNCLKDIAKFMGELKK